MHGLFFGRIAPSATRAPGDRARRPSWSATRLDPIHPAADAAMLADELPDAHVRGGRPSILEWRLSPERLDQAAVEFALGCWRRRRAAAPRGAPRSLATARRGRIGGVPLYRDEAIVLRTHKLGEADRIITLLTRQHGGSARSPRAYAGPRRASAPGSSRSPTSTCSSPRAATSTSITQAETLDAVRHAGSAPTTTATPPAP